MKLRKVVGLPLGLLRVLASVFVFAQQKKAAPPMDEKAAMEMMQKLATPGEAHRKLDALVGDWVAKNTIWMDPSKPPEVTEGTSVHRWVLGQRFVGQHYDGKLFGQPFSGMGFTGYDNYRKKYISIWMDTSTTTIMNMSGSFDAAGKVLTTTGEMDDFTTGKAVTLRETTTIVNKDEILFEMFALGPSGKEYKMMEIRYTRKK